MVNFVPASAAANILRRNLNANNNHPVAEAGFIVNIYFLSEHISPLWRQLMISCADVARALNISPTTESRATSCGAELSDLEQQLTIFIILPII
jgi:hypothetical protein